MTYKYQYFTQSQLGELFGVSSHKIGDWLVKAGLRTEKKRPSDEAHRGGYCETAPSGQQGYHWVWSAEKTVARLREAGHQLVPNLPQHLVEPPILNGPFSVRAGNGHFEIINGDETAAVWANTRKNADLIAKLLNAAHRCGALERHMATDKCDPPQT